MGRRSSAYAGDPGPYAPGSRGLPAPTIVVPPPCEEPDCGQPRTGGRPRAGWVQIHIAVQPGSEPQADRWFCGWNCLSRHAIRQELAALNPPAAHMTVTCSDNTTRTMRQVAPWPSDLENLVAHTTYREGWTVALADEDRDGHLGDPERHSVGLTLTITTDTINSYPPHERMWVQHPLRTSGVRWRAAAAAIEQALR